MNFSWIFFCVCLIESSTHILGRDYHSQNGNEHQAISADSSNGPQKLINIPLHQSRSGLTHGIKLLDLVQENGSNPIQDHFSTKLLTTIQGIITDVISNPQMVSSLLALIPTFPPAAIVGSFIMVVLSILQNPTFLKFFQNILPDIKSRMDNPIDITIPKYLSEFNDLDTDKSELVKEGLKYGTKLVDIASKELHLGELNLQESGTANHQYPKRTIRSHSEHEKGHKSGRYQNNDAGKPIPLIDLK